MTAKRVCSTAESDFVSLWKMGYARESFRYVRTVCDYIIEQNVDRYSPIHHPLCVAAVIFYARPFKKSNVIGAIPVAVVPEKYRWLHGQLITLRDQVAAHTDADAISHGTGGPPA